MSEEQPDYAKIRRVWTLFGPSALPADLGREGGVPEIRSLTDTELLITLSGLHGRKMGGTDQAEAGRRAILAELDLRISARAQEQTRALVGATETLREAMTQAAEADRALRRTLETERLNIEATERELDRRAGRAGARWGFVAGIAGAILTAVLTALLGWLLGG